MNIFWLIIGLALSYLVGAIPTAYVITRVLSGKDITKLGSGNVGATNALRVLGKVPGIIVLVLDVLKGLVAVVIIAYLFAPRINMPVSGCLSPLSNGSSVSFIHFFNQFSNFA